MNPTKHIAVVDDHIAVLKGYEAILNDLSYVKCVSLFSTGHELLKFLTRKEVDAVLLDIRLKEENGLEICRELKCKYPDLLVILISFDDSPEYVVRAEQHGADGILIKDCSLEETISVLNGTLLTGSPHYPARIKELIFDYERRKMRSRLFPKKTPTAREIQILRLICEGCSNKEIAISLMIEATTIAKHRQNMMKKVGAKNVADLIKYAITHKFYQP